MVPARRQAGSSWLLFVKFTMENTYHVYAIQSKVDNRLYVGLSKNPEKRLRGHNNGETFSTKGFRPWHLVYTEKVGSRKDARKREKYLKSGIGKEFLKSIIPR